MSLDALYGNNKWDQELWPVRAVWAELRMKTRSKQPKGIRGAVNSACGTLD